MSVKYPKHQAAGFALNEADMRGIEMCVGWVRFVPPIQGGGTLFGSVSWGYARRSTPGCHITGFQPSDLRSAIYWTKPSTENCYE